MKPEDLYKQKYRPKPSSIAVARRMSLVKRRDSKPELALRKLLWARGMRYRIDSRPVPTLRRKADIVFRNKKVAVFIDGCFWHGCAKHCVWPKKNAEWWRKKILQNRKRDRETDKLLGKMGWTPIRIWEHDDPALSCQLIIKALGKTGG